MEIIEAIQPFARMILFTFPPGPPIGLTLWKGRC